jgi:phosphoglucosamine mutase
MPQVLVNATVKLENKEKYMENEQIASACQALEDEFAGEGRVLIRPSGTEPLVRVMIEGKDKKYITEKATELAKMIEDILG